MCKILKSAKTKSVINNSLLA